MDQVHVVVAHSERATLRVGDVFLKIDADPNHHDVEEAVGALLPIRTPEVLWRKPPVLALARMPGVALGSLEGPSTASTAAWIAAGTAVRRVHDSPLPPWPNKRLGNIAEHLANECDWLVANNVVPADVVSRNRALAEAALEPRPLAFVHGDLQVDHVFVDGDEVTGIIDWSEASQGDAVFDLATLTLGHPERLDDVLTGYGADIDRDLIRGSWSLRCLSNIRWLIEHGFGTAENMYEIAVLHRLR